MNFKPTRWKIIVCILIFLISVLIVDKISRENVKSLYLSSPFWLSLIILFYLIWSLFQKGKKIDTLLDNTKIEVPYIEKVVKKKSIKSRSRKKSKK